MAQSSGDARLPVRTRGRLPRWGAAAIAVTLVTAAGFGAWFGARHVFTTFGPDQCQATVSDVSYTLDPEQTGNAALIAGIATRRNLPPRAVTIALATALQESKLRNIEYGDRDSLGLFQQRPSSGWGTPEQILDPVYATNRFFDALVKIKGYQKLEITVAAQKVQRSAYPTAYAKHEGRARVFASALTGETPAALGCRLDDPEPQSISASEKAESLAADLKRHLKKTGTAAAVDGAEDQMVVSVGVKDEADRWAVAAWAVGRAEIYGVTRVAVERQEWNRTRDDTALRWTESEGAAGPAATVVIVVTAPE